MSCGTFLTITHFLFMKARHILGGLFAGLLLVGAGCSQSAAPATNNQAAGEPIKIGFISPLTGDASSMGVPTKQAAELAVEEINKAGGVGGRQLQLIAEDGKCSPKDASSAAAKLIDIDKVVAIVGGLCSSETSAFAPGAMQKKVIVFSHTSSAPSLSKTGKYFFRSYPSDAYQGKIAAEYAYNTLGARKVALVFHVTDWGTGLRDVFTARFKELGGEILLTEGAPQESRDYKTIVAKVKASGADLIYAPTYPDGATVLLKQLRDAGVATKILGGDGWSDTKLQANAKGIKDVYFVEPKAAAPTDAFKAALLAKTGGKEVSLGTQQAYDNVKLLAQVFGQVGTDPDKAADALRASKYDGTSGHIEFDANGDLVGGAYEYKMFKDGSSVLVQ